MAFWGSLSQWFRGRAATAAGPDDSAAEDAPGAGDKKGALFDLAEDGLNLEPGLRCLMLVADQHYLVEVMTVEEDEIRMSFPGIDYPVAGMLADLEFHDETGVSRYPTRVIDGPHKEGDGVLLERPTVEQRQRHRDSFRLDIQLDAQVKLRGSEEEAQQATVLNLSTGGARFQTEAEFNDGDVVDLEIELPDKRKAALSVDILHAIDVTWGESGKLHLYGSSFESYELGAGQTITSFISDRLRQRFPSA